MREREANANRSVMVSLELKARQTESSIKASEFSVQEDTKETSRGTFLVPQDVSCFFFFGGAKNKAGEEKTRWRRRNRKTSTQKKQDRMKGLDQRQEKEDACSSKTRWLSKW